MGFMFVILVSSIAGAIGWWVGNLFGVAFALVLSIFASCYGYVLGHRWNRDYFG